LPQHGVHEGGLPVVYVGDDGDVANILTHKILASSGRAATSH
jgi:Cu/Zn superoxide dismutase